MSLKLVRINSEAGDFHALVSKKINGKYFKGCEGAPSVSDVDVLKELADTPPDASSVFYKQLSEVAAAFRGLSTSPALKERLKTQELLVATALMGHGRFAAHVLFCSPDGVSVVDSFPFTTLDQTVAEGFEYLLHRVEGFSESADIAPDTWQVYQLEPGCNRYIIAVAHSALDCSYQLNIVELN